MSTTARSAREYIKTIKINYLKIFHKFCSIIARIFIEICNILHIATCVGDRRPAPFYKKGLIDCTRALMM
jgi:hypothetical protein